MHATSIAVDESFAFCLQTVLKTCAIGARVAEMKANLWHPMRPKQYWDAIYYVRKLIILVVSCYYVDWLHILWIRRFCCCCFFVVAVVQPCSHWTQVTYNVQCHTIFVCKREIRYVRLVGNVTNMPTASVVGIDRDKVRQRYRGAACQSIAWLNCNSQSREKKHNLNGHFRTFYNSSISLCLRSFFGLFQPSTWD